MFNINVHDIQQCLPRDLWYSPKPIGGSLGKILIGCCAFAVLRLLNESDILLSVTAADMLDHAILIVPHWLSTLASFSRFWWRIISFLWSLIPRFLQHLRTYLLRPALAFSNQPSHIFACLIT